VIKRPCDNDDDDNDDDGDGDDGDGDGDGDGGGDESRSECRVPSATRLSEIDGRSGGRAECLEGRKQQR